MAKNVYRDKQMKHKKIVSLLKDLFNKVTNGTEVTTQIILTASIGHNKTVEMCRVTPSDMKGTYVVSHHWNNIIEHSLGSGGEQTVSNRARLIQTVQGLHTSLSDRVSHHPETFGLPPNVIKEVNAEFKGVKNA